MQPNNERVSPKFAVKSLGLKVIVGALLISFLMMGSFSSAHAASHVQIAKHTAAVPSAHAVLPAGSCSSYVYVVIRYNYGNNVFCVTRTGYNGLDFNLSHVTSVGVVGCVQEGWLRAYNGGPGFYSHFNYLRNIYSGPQPPYGLMTQIDVVSTFC